MRKTSDTGADLVVGSKYYEGGWINIQGKILKPRLRIMERNPIDSGYYLYSTYDAALKATYEDLAPLLKYSKEYTKNLENDLIELEKLVKDI